MVGFANDIIINHIHSQKVTSVSLSQDSEHTNNSHRLTYPVQPSSISNTNLPLVAPQQNPPRNRQPPKCFRT